MLNCKDITLLCSDELERPLRLGERTELRMHVLMCAGCRNYRLQTHALHRAMQVYAAGGAPPDAGLGEDEVPPAR